MICASTHIISKSGGLQRRQKKRYFPSGVTLAAASQFSREPSVPQVKDFLSHTVIRVVDSVLEERTGKVFVPS